MRDVQGLSIVKPPYGVMAAIDVNKGDLLWQVPHGDTPDNVRNHPALKGLNIPKTGQNGSVGTLVTKTLVVAGDPRSPRRRDVRAARCFTRTTRRPAAELGAVYMPAAQSGSPMTYSVDGKRTSSWRSAAATTRASTSRSACRIRKVKK